MGQTARGTVEFLITSEALAEMLNPDLDGIDNETALEVFIEFETAFHLWTPRRLQAVFLRF
jgi:hypothetical protein